MVWEIEATIAVDDEVAPSLYALTVEQERYNNEGIHSKSVGMSIDDVMYRTDSHNITGPTRQETALKETELLFTAVQPPPRRSSGASNVVPWRGISVRCTS